MSSRKLGRHEVMYGPFDEVISSRKPAMTYLEVGTASGERAARLCRYWKSQTGGRFVYLGFDEFEDAGPTAPHRYTVESKLSQAGAVVTLFKGTVYDSLLAFADAMGGRLVPDVVLVTGRDDESHFEKTWAALARAVGPHTVTVLDFYVDKAGVGCKSLVDALKASGRHDVEVLVPEGESCKLASVRSRKPEAAATAA